MIRKLQQCDIDQVITIWLEASIQAHDFISREFWGSKVKDMRDIYIPCSETYVYEYEDEIKGFISLSHHTISAIFVSPDCQGKGIGTQLLEKAKALCNNLNLAVYKENVKSIAFYKKHGFQIQKEQIDKHTGHPELVMQYTPSQ